MISDTSPSSLDVAREAYRAISLYAPNREPCAVDLSDNTNLWGVPPAAERAVREAALASFTRYPSLYAPALKGAMAAYLGVEPGMIVTGCGSDDVLDSAIRAFAEPGERVAVPEPSFAMVPIFARMNALEPVAVPLTPTFDLDADAMLATGARVIYLCSPNNPTGNAMSRAAIERVVERAPGVVILDEAYAEFAGANCLELLGRSERLLVVRTMSKAFGLAGLRVGYAAGAPALVAEVEKSRGPYKVHALAERAALAALTDAESMRWVRERVAEVRENRARLVDELTTLGYETVPSDANFVLVSIDNAQDVARAMRAAGVAVRPFDIGLRVTVGPWGSMEELLRVLADARAAE